MTDEQPDSLLNQYISYFRGRGDAYGNAKGFCVHQPLTAAVFKQHLTSLDPDKHIGVYCMVGEMCSWGCIDIDGKDFPAPRTDIDSAWEHDWDRMWRLALNLRTVLAVKDVHAHIERTKNGFHLWVFPDVPLVPARAMRRALMAACRAISYDPKEVNPKAEGPRPGTKGLGNFVRLPYGGALHPDYRPVSRYMADNSLSPISLDVFVQEPSTTSLAALEEVAALWTPPPVPHHNVDIEAGMDAAPILKLLDGLTFTIWRYGPLPGSDRSTTLARLAHHCAEYGITATQTYAVVKSADERWGGKFANRADGAEQMARIVENAYSKFDL